MLSRTGGHVLNGMGNAMKMPDAAHSSQRTQYFRRGTGNKTDTKEKMSLFKNKNIY
jgi:hypothetical protein